MSGPLGSGSPLGSGGGGGGDTLATLYTNGSVAADSTFVLDSTRGGIIIDGTALTTLSGLVVKNGLAGGGVVAQVTGTARTGFNLRDSGGTDRWTFGYAVSANDWLTGSAAGDAVIGGPTGKFLCIGLLGGAAPIVSFDMANARAKFAKTAATAGTIFGDALTAVTGFPHQVEIGNSSGHCGIRVGQDATHNLGFSWIYNATASAGIGQLNTFGFTNRLDIDGTPVVMQANAGVGKNVLIGSTTDPSARLYVSKGSNAATSGTQRTVYGDATFAPTSGTAAFRGAEVVYTINQTGGANGNVTGLLVNGTETALVGTHNLLDLQIAGTSKLAVDNAGKIIFGIGATAVGGITPAILGTVPAGAGAAAQNAWVRVKVGAADGWFPFWI